MSAPLTFQRYDTGRVDDVRADLVAIYAEVYADRLDDPFFSVDRFLDRLRRHTGEPNWEAVLGYAGGEPVGYAYGASRRAGTDYWRHVTPVPDAEFARETGERTFMLFELMARVPWRKTGAARAIHDRLLAGRHEQRVSLAVEHEHPKVRSLYEQWGYTYVGQRKPFPDAPLMDIMVQDMPHPDADAPLRGDASQG